MTLYIATDLTQREIDLADIDPFAEQPDLRINGQLYRVLVPEYYAYLRQQMQRLKQAVDAGQLDQDTYRPLADRFNALHATAVTLFGEDALRAALRSLNPRSYRVPGDGVDVIEVQPAPQRAWTGQGTLAGFAADGTSMTAPVIAGPVTIGQRVRTFGTEVIITGYHAPDENFPGGWIDVVTDAGVTGSADLRFVKDLQGQALVPMTRTPEEQRIAALPDEPFELTDADLDVSDLPEPHYYPAGDDPALRFYQPVSPRAVEAVDAIRAQALALGWTEPMLYQNRGRFAFPYGQDFGLVCFLGGGKVVGEITADTIAICVPTSGGTTLTFARPHLGKKE
ncbi:MAG: hypothetical protein BWY76_02602 [bacterium ADurb.Bin429]|nr:MAG: hypothetical protein BWY76_02602 [bacterium ADurb.Bin429]